MPDTGPATRGLTEIRVCVPEKLLDRFDAIVKEEKAYKNACRKAGRDVSDERMSRSNLAASALLYFVERYERNRAANGPKPHPKPRPRGRPKKAEA